MPGRAVSADSNAAATVSTVATVKMRVDILASLNKILTGTVPR